MNTFSPQNDRYLFLDMNSFFARCEQQVNPTLRNKPVVVAPYTGNTGCCIAVSYEAKELGVKTGMKVGEAKNIVRSLIVVESNPTLYRQIHHRLVKIVSQFTPWLIIKSIDEMTFPLCSYERGNDNPFKLALRIKHKLKNNLGDRLTASIGVGPNIFLAKQGAEAKKPDGLTVIRIEDIPGWIKNWQLTDLKGINHRMERRLQYLGIYSPLDLYSLPRQILREKLGIAGEYWWFRLHGYDIDRAPTRRSSIGHSCVLPPEGRNWNTARQVLRKLVERAGERLRNEKLEGRGVTLTVHYLGGGGWNNYLKTNAFSDSQTFWRYANLLWQKMPKPQKPLLIAITAINVTRQIGEQLELYSQVNKQKLIFEALDIINTRFGQFTLKPASLIGADSFAPNRIPFGNTQL